MRSLKDASSTQKSVSNIFQSYARLAFSECFLWTTKNKFMVLLVTYLYVQTTTKVDSQITKTILSHLSAVITKKIKTTLRSCRKINLKKMKKWKKKKRKFKKRRKHKKRMMMIMRMRKRKRKMVTFYFNFN